MPLYTSTWSCNLIVYDEEQDCALIIINQQMRKLFQKLLSDPTLGLLLV
jgi:hypothetical protein